ncbi:MAG: hypothetical protein LUQ41_04400, partial [Methanomicrobiales archaeon]|nr:hypothetical protein [Methanomicrobiales archaeon]
MPVVRMKRYNDYILAATILIAAAAVLLLVTLFTARGDLTTAMLILSGISCFITAIFILTLYKGEPFDAQFTNLLPVAAQRDLCRICADLGAQGNGVTLPTKPELTGHQVMHFVPVSLFRHPEIRDDFSFVLDATSPGVLLIPGGYPLFALLQEKFSLQISPGEADLLTAVQVVCREVLEVADRVEAVRTGNVIAVTLHHYLLFPGCAAVRKESPKCCTVFPCPVCSLVLCILA